MESRDSGHKRSNTQGGLVPIEGSQSYGRKILPYEKQLAELLGISEQEYVRFSEELKARQKPRPAEYAHIPDIRNEPAVTTSILISLAIGAVTTAASILLAPKPRQDNVEVQELKQRKLGDLTGPTRFNSTYGFDSVAPLAQWGDVIPIPFGKYTGESGGLLITPSLVWSRLFSFGNHQMAKLLYACGEHGLSVPNLRGIFMGNAPLDGSFAHNFTVYFRPEEANMMGFSRIKANDLLYGTRATPSSGDPETFDDIFSCPTLESEEDQGFCYAYTPGQNTSFGFYSPIANGTVLRTNWKVVSLPQLNQKDDPSGRIKQERIKISGFGGREDGMPGQGRGYGRRIGIIEYNNGSGFVSPSVREDVFVAVDSEVKVYISAKDIDKDYDEDRTGVNTDDLNNTSVQERTQADEQLQLGETLQIGRTVWVVTERSIPIWSGDEGQYITLKCVEQFGSPQITVVPKSMIDRTVLNDGVDFTDTNHVGLSSTPIGYQAMGIARAVRPCDVLEVGLKSRVFLQANGLCNFNELPSPEQLRSFDEDGTTITNGNMNLYMQRSSCFTIKVRPISVNGAAVYEWGALAEQFVIRGNSPVDMYNFIRFYFPVREQQFEFRFEPLPGANVVKLFEANEIFYELDARSTSYQTIISDTVYGTFKLRFAGRAVVRDDLLVNKELGIDRVPAAVTVQGDRPTKVGISFYTTSPVDTGHGKAHGWRGEVLGFPQLYQGLTRSAEIFCTSGTRSITLKITCTSVEGRVQASAPGWTPVRYTNWRWDAPRVEIISASEGWNAGDKFTFSKSITSDPSTGNNKWLVAAYGNRARTVTATFEVQEIGDLVVSGGRNIVKRVFAPSSQVADVSYYPGLLTASNSDNPEHEIVYVNEITDNQTMPTYSNMTMFGLSLRSGRNISGIEQLRFWVSGGIDVKRWYPQAAHFDNQNVTGRSNLFSDLLYFLLTDPDAGAGDKVSAEMIDEDSFELTAKFLSANKIFCDVVLQEPVNIRQWATQIAPLMLCNFTVSNGKFGVFPALPTDTSGKISLSAVPIAAIFTEGNIIEDTFECTYIRAEERAEFKAVATYRTARTFELPERLSVIVRYAGPDTGRNPIEEFDMADWCTQEQQAITTCKYMLALRKHVTHAVSFKTSPDGLSLKPGDFIRVLTQSNPFIPTNVGTVGDKGQVNGVEPLADGTYAISYYVQGQSQDVQTGSLTIQNGVVPDSNFHNIVFSTTDTITESGVYFVERLTLDEDCMVEVVASVFPCDDQLVSSIARDVLANNDSSYWWISK